jgi:hypothetical protein
VAERRLKPAAWPDRKRKRRRLDGQGEPERGGRLKDLVREGQEAEKTSQRQRQRQRRQQRSAAVGADGGLNASWFAGSAGGADEAGGRSWPA